MQLIMILANLNIKLKLCQAKTLAGVKMEANKRVGHFNVSRASALIFGATASTTRGQYLSI